jgi:excisionase family DNA binding protein
MPVVRRLLKPDAEIAEQPVVANSPRLLTLKEAAAYFASSVWYIRQMIRNRELPHIRIGRRLLLDRVDLDHYIERNKVRR